MKIPTDRSELKGGECFAFVLSKVAPLEWWAFHETIAEVTPDRYRSESGYQSALHNTWEFPRFCFSLFRPSRESFAALLAAVEGYSSHARWWLHDGDCIGARQEKPEAIRISSLSYEELAALDIEKHNASLRRPPDMAFLADAMADIPTFCSYLEERLGLKEKEPQGFDPLWRTVEGLAQSRGDFEDFLDLGLWCVFLAREPRKYMTTSQATSEVDRSLGMELSLGQRDQLFEELGADWTAARDGETGTVIADFPLLSRFDDPTNDVIYEANEVGLFLEELRKAQQKVKGLKSIRGLDNLVRIARWAEKLTVGIYFGGV